MSVENYDLLKRVTHVCQHPVKVNINGTFRYLPCRKCAACLNNRTSRYSHLIQLEAQQWDVTLFVTLTYAPQYLPELYISNCRKVVALKDDNPRCSESRYLLEYRDTKTDLIVVSSIYNKVELLQQKCELDGHLPYLRKSDLQKFFKRLKYHATKLSLQTSYTYFACGEYGPAHFRPHYHIVLHTTRKALQHIQNAIYKSWKLGRIDMSVDRGKSANYVSSYTTSYSTIPLLYSDKAVRPFFVHSFHYGLHQYVSQAKFIIENPKSYVSIPLNTDKGPMDIRSWSSFSFTFFPKIPKFTELSKCSFYYLRKMYTLFESIPPNMTLNDYAHYLLDLSYTSGILHDIYKYYHIEYTFNAIYSTILISRRFHQICQHFNFTSHYYLRQILKYYKEFEKRTLKDWYQVRSLLTSEEQLFCYDSSYDGFVEIDGFYMNLDLIERDYANVFQNMYNIASYRYDGIYKHKYQNDLNKMFH